MDEDIKLIEEYLSGKEEAIEDIVVKYQKKIYAVIYRITNDMEEAKDLTQKTFLSALKGLRDFRRDSSFKTWLYQIAINTGLNHIKRNRREEGEPEGTLKANQSGALSILIEEEKKECIRKCLTGIPERQRLTLLLRVYEGLSVSETAKVMECSEGAVKAHYHNAIKRLRGVLKGSGYDIKP